MSNYAIFSRAFGQSEQPSIDAESGVIRGVAVITEGPALGHYDELSGLPMFADATTLQEVQACAASYAGGLKVKMTHGGDAADIVGVLRNFRIDGNVLRADFFALKTTPHRAYIFEVANELPHAFGLSIAFSGEREVVGERAMARCVEIYSADLVSEPAANPTGLFTARPQKVDTQPTAKQHLSKMDPDKLTESLAKLSEQIEAMGARLSKLETPDMPEGEAPEVEEPESEMADAEKAAELAAAAALKLFTAKFGVPANATPSHAAPNPAAKKAETTFESLVAEQVKAGKSKADAIRYCRTAHREAHQSYEARVRAGELITL